MADVVAELGEDEWQFRPHGVKNPAKTSVWTEKEDGARKTRVVDGACIFLNRPGFPAGSRLRASPARRPHRSAPAHDEARRLLAAADPPRLPPGLARRRHELPRGDDRRVRPAWLGAGGHDLDWYCSGNPEAHVGREPVYRTSHAELVELMGEEAYAELVVRCEAHLKAVKAARSVGSRQLLPLLVHPATLEAGVIPGKRPAPRPASAKKGGARRKDSGPTRPGRRRSARTPPDRAAAYRLLAPAPAMAIRSPNIWDTPEVYEVENLASDRAGVIEAAIDRLHPIAGRRLVDIGCGTGFHLPVFAGLGARVVGVEPHQPLVARARERLREVARAGGPGAGGRLRSCGRRGAEALPLADGSVDIAHARWAYFFGAGCEPGLAELDRVDPPRRGRLPRRQRRHALDVRGVVPAGLPGIRPRRRSSGSGGGRGSRRRR